MATIGVDLGGTKIGSALLADGDNLLFHHKILLGHATGDEVGGLIRDRIRYLLAEAAQIGVSVTAAGISVPGICRPDGTVWAPNLPGWENYPLLAQLQHSFPGIDFYLTNDRACYILGEVWKGKARGCKEAIFIAVGTGLAAGILVNGEVLNGAHGVAGAIGWLGHNRPYDEKYIPMGCNEYYASGEGIVRYAREVLAARPAYRGVCRTAESLTASLLFEAYDQNDEVAVEVVRNTVAYWGMTVANLVSTFNPEKIIFGGGVFGGHASRLLEDIYKEALQWGQPVSMRQVELACSEIGEMAGLYGTLYHALQSENKKQRHA